MDLDFVGWAKSLVTTYPRGQPRVSDFAHAERAEQARLPTLQIVLGCNPLSLDFCFAEPS